MALRHIPSSFECDCGHMSHFFENTVREAERLSERRHKPVLLSDSEPEEHTVEFQKGKAVAVLCPERGRCAVTGWI